MNEDCEEIVKSICDLNCIECKHFKESVQESICICEPIMEMIHRECEVKTENDEDLCCNYWEKYRKFLLEEVE